MKDITFKNSLGEEINIQFDDYGMNIEFYLPFGDGTTLSYDDAMALAKFIMENQKSVTQ